MISYLFFKKFNIDFFFLRNNYFNFVFFFNVEKSIFFSFCFKMSNFFFFFNFVNVLFLVFPFFYRRDLITIKNSIFQLFFCINIFIKQRLRFSGLGYFVDFFPQNKILNVNVGLTNPQTFLLPGCVYEVKLNKKKKKLLLKGYIFYLLNNFCSLIRFIKRCDVYKHKGVRWRFEVIRTKEGKRSGRR